MTSEFSHYAGCNGRDPDNCSACALTDTRQDAPNYSGLAARLHGKRAHRARQMARGFRR